MVRGLTARQRQLLAIVKTHLRESGGLPPLRALGVQLGGVTPAAIHLQLAVLAQKGYLRWPRGRPRAVELLQPVERVRAVEALRVPIVGTIAAGEPIDAFETPDGSVLVELAQLRAGDRTPGQPGHLYALRVRGHSMVDACIQDGDVVIVRRQASAEDGDTVVALLNGEQATLKRFYRESGRVRLRAANPYYPDLVTQEVQIQGKVIGVVRFC
ncbi:MAG: repressor LexA [Chloroflexi bacterium]|nr:repressor LexA [Chloroflexota bacterium]